MSATLTQHVTASSEWMVHDSPGTHRTDLLLGLVRHTHVSHAPISCCRRLCEAPRYCVDGRQRNRDHTLPFACVSPPGNTPKRRDKSPHPRGPPVGLFHPLSVISRHQ